MSHARRSLSFYDGIGIIVGIIIGSGIFSSPGLALQRAGSPGLTLLAWLAASILVAITCQCYFELACMMPSAGGDYEYLHQAYGNRTAFAFAWFNFFIAKPGSHAIISTIFGHYFATVITGKSVYSSTDEQTSSISKVSSVMLITIITLINCYGIKESSNFQNILTVSKILLVCFLIIVAFIYAIQYPATITENLSITSSHSSFSNSKSVLSFGSSLIACLWSYDGWGDIIFLIEDLKDPFVQLPRVILSSIAIVTCCYMLANIAYFSVLSASEIKSSSAIAYDLGVTVAHRLPGMAGLPIALALGVALSACGSVHGSILAGGKALQAVARDGRAPHCLTFTSIRGAPYVALLCQGTWGIMLLLLPASGFSSLLSYFGPASWFFYALTSSAVITLRVRHPRRPRPYLLPFYPLPVLMVIAVACVIVASAFVAQFVYTSLAFCCILVSLPVHAALQRYGALRDSPAVREVSDSPEFEISHSAGGDGFRLLPKYDLDLSSLPLSDND